MGRPVVSCDAGDNVNPGLRSANVVNESFLLVVPSGRVPCTSPLMNYSAVYELEVLGGGPALRGRLFSLPP